MAAKAICRLTYLGLRTVVADDALQEDRDVVLVDVGHDIVRGRDELEIAHLQPGFLEQFPRGASFKRLAEFEMTARQSPFSCRLDQL